jgi:hypothetical protein
MQRKALDIARATPITGRDLNPPVLCSRVLFCACPTVPTHSHARASVATTAAPISGRCSVSRVAVHFFAQPQLTATLICLSNRCHSLIMTRWDPLLPSTQILYQCATELNPSTVCKRRPSRRLKGVPAPPSALPTFRVRSNQKQTDGTSMGDVLPCVYCSLWYVTRTSRSRETY